MMKAWEDHPIVMMVGLCVLVFVLIVALQIIWESAACHSKWGSSGFSSSYGPLQGCLIQHEGKWIPEHNYREMP